MISRHLIIGTLLMSFFVADIASASQTQQCRQTLAPKPRVRRAAVIAAEEKPTVAEAPPPTPVETKTEASKSNVEAIAARLAKIRGVIEPMLVEGRTSSAVVSAFLLRESRHELDTLIERGRELEASVPSDETGISQTNQLNLRLQHAIEIMTSPREVKRNWWGKKKDSFEPLLDSLARVRADIEAAPKFIKQLEEENEALDQIKRQIEDLQGDLRRENNYLQELIFTLSEIARRPEVSELSANEINGRILGDVMKHQDEVAEIENLTKLKIAAVRQRIDLNDLAAQTARDLTSSTLENALALNPDIRAVLRPPAQKFVPPTDVLAFEPLDPRQFPVEINSVVWVDRNERGWAIKAMIMQVRGDGTIEVRPLNAAGSSWSEESQTAYRSQIAVGLPSTRYFAGRYMGEVVIVEHAPNMFASGRIRGIFLDGRVVIEFENNELNSKSGTYSRFVPMKETFRRVTWSPNGGGPTNIAIDQPVITPDGPGFVRGYRWENEEFLVEVDQRLKRYLSHELQSAN